MEKIDKKQALKRLAVIEEETKELKAIINKEDDWTSIIDFESACNYFGRDADDKLNKWKYADLTMAQINGLMLETCIGAVNNAGKDYRWIPDWSNVSQRKWYNYFEKKSFGWSLFCAGDYCYRSGVGFGFYYETEEKAKHGAKYFKKYYDIWLGN